MTINGALFEIEGDADANGLELHYARTGGAGPPFVISHGVFDDGFCRTPLARDLAETHDVIVYDARGHGRSDAPESGYGPEERAADLVALIETLDFEAPILFGHSMGGDTVAAAAARHPDLPRAVVLEDPACLLSRGDEESETDDDGEREATLAAVHHRIARWHERSKEELLREDEELREHVESGDEELASLLADARLRVSPNVVAVFESDFVDPAETFPAIDAPTLILRADVDEDERARDREAAARLPNGRLVHVEGTGHCVFRDRREAATRELRSFLEEL